MNNILLVFILTTIIHLLNTLILSVRIVGIETKKMAATYSVYNIIFLLIRFANTLQAPLLSKHIELSINNNEVPENYLFYGLIFFSFIGAVGGIFLIPTTVQFMKYAVNKAHEQNSVIQLIFNIKFKNLSHYFKKSYRKFSLPNKHHLSLNGLPLIMIAMNLIITSLITVSVLSCLYAGYINPILRTTCLSLNGFIIGIATILSMLITEPHLNILADKVAFHGQNKDTFMRYLRWVIVSRIIGTGLGIFLLVPMAYFVVFLAESVF